MNKLTYEVYSGELFLTDYVGDETDECEITVKECSDASFSIGSESFKLKDGVGRVNLSNVKKGTYTPTLILDEGLIFGGALKIGGTAVRISPASDVVKREARELLIIKKLDVAEREISALKDMVYGTTIF